MKLNKYSFIDLILTFQNSYNNLSEFDRKQLENTLRDKLNLSSNVNLNDSEIQKIFIKELNNYYKFRHNNSKTRLLSVILVYFVTFFISIEMVAINKFPILNFFIGILYFCYGISDIDSNKANIKGYIYTRINDPIEYYIIMYSSLIIGISLIVSFFVSLNP